MQGTASVALSPGLHWPSRPGRRCPFGSMAALTAWDRESQPGSVHSGKEVFPEHLSCKGTSYTNSPTRATLTEKTTENVVSLQGWTAYWSTVYPRKDTISFLKNLLLFIPVLLRNNDTGDYIHLNYWLWWFDLNILWNNYQLDSATIYLLK